jgi:predicted O-methyltransferase YrrM
MTKKSISLNKEGDPIEASMKMCNLDNRDPHTALIRDVAKWKHSEKPYTCILAKTAVSSSESHLLYDSAKRLGSGNYANLGVAAGRSVGCIAWGLKHNGHEGKVYAVDLFRWYSRDIYQPEGLMRTLDSVKEYVELCKGSTQDWAETLKDKQFKLVFIDASHQYETCKLDFELWGNLVEVGGEIAFHDTHKNTVDRVIQEIDLAKWTQTDHIYSLKLFKKIA